MAKENILREVAIKAMAETLNTEVGKLRDRRKRALGMLRNSDGEDYEKAAAEIIRIDNELKEWKTAYANAISFIA